MFYKVIKIILISIYCGYDWYINISPVLSIFGSMQIYFYIKLKRKRTQVTYTYKYLYICKCK
jgi:hypothetical protein